jgi:hypothetical protein
MGKYVTSCLLCKEDTLVDSLFCSREDISLGFNNGYYVGREAVKGYYEAVCAATAKKSKCLQKIFPEKLGNLSDEELYGVGPFKAEPLTSFYMQEAEDLQTAKAIWMVEGSITDITEKGPVTNWSWGYYAADFIKEDGQMKLWHVLRVEDVHCPNGVDWGMPENPHPDLPEFQELADITLPAPNHPAQVHELYSADRGPSQPPRIPEPYKTFAETFSYGV